MMADRYDTAGNPEGEFEPGSGGLILKNKLGITDPAEMDDEELGLLEELYEAVISSSGEADMITTDDLSEWHRMWLGEVYDWAGITRTVNLGKGDFFFAAANQIPKLLTELDEILARYTPCKGMSDGDLIEAIAYVHVEFILIHPFREGNGRLARLLATVMALQAGKPEPDFTSWHECRDEYFSAIQQGMAGNYEPMEAFVKKALRDAESGLGF